MKDFEKSEVFDIACNYKYCIAIIEKGELKTWGKYLAVKSSAKKVENNANKEGGNEENSNNYFVVNYPTGNNV